MLKFIVKTSSMPHPSPKPNNRKHQPVPSDVVDPIWLLKALAGTVIVASICGYLTFCFLFYQGQWQLILRPTRASNNPSTVAGAPYQIVHFGPDESAIPQLVGWWIPSTSEGPYARRTILFLAGSEGSIADAIPTLSALHNMGINVFAFDYRGYGQSAQTHPNQKNMARDAESAWKYLTTSRTIASQQIIPYGCGVGASLAVSLAQNHSEIPAIILDAPRGDLLDAAIRDRRSHLLPVRLLFHERFPLAEPLSKLRTPKLLLSRASSPDDAFRSAAAPKLTVELPTPSNLPYFQSLTRFLDEIPR